MPGTRVEDSSHVRGPIFLPLSLSLFACASEYHPEYHPQTEVAYSQNVSYATTVFESGGKTVTSDAPESAPPAHGDPSRVLILQSTHLDRPTEVVGVIDAHLPVGSQDAAIAAVRKRAAEMGADAVVGVEFHHGEAPGEPTHLSGLAVRFLQAVPYPVGR
jgi:hypothetical protein